MREDKKKPVGGVFFFGLKVRRGDRVCRLDFGCGAVVLITVRWRPESSRLETFMRPATASGGYGYVRGGPTRPSFVV